MHRCYIEPARWTDARIRPSSEEEHHLKDVLRASDGDVVVVFDGAGREAQARVVSASPGIFLDVVPGTQQTQRPSCSVALYQAVLKGPRMDFLVEKATELGVTAIVPLLTERVVVRVAGERREDRRQRWERVARAAAKQCGHNVVPEIRPIAALAEALDVLGAHDLVLAGSLADDAVGIKTQLEQVGEASRIAILIGPEGDFTPGEMAQCVAAGATGVNLGPRTLRAETAALFALSVVNYELGR